MELAHGRPVVHCVERGNLVNAHGRHLEQPSHLVHDADRSKAVLSLTEVENRHDRGLLVLGWVAFEDFGDDGLILAVELKRDIGVVIG